MTPQLEKLKAKLENEGCVVLKPTESETQIIRIMMIALHETNAQKIMTDALKAYYMSPVVQQKLEELKC